MRDKSITKFYNIYKDEVYIYILSLCHDHYLAQDIMQEVFVKAILSLDISHKNTKAWLFRVAKNLWVDYLRKNKNISNTDIKDLHIEDKTQGILDKIIKTEENSKLYKEIMKLKPSMKEVIILYYYLDIEQNQIANIMGISNGNVRTMIYRARKILKDMLEDI